MELKHQKTLKDENFDLYEHIQLLGKTLAMGRCDGYDDHKRDCRNVLHRVFNMGREYERSLKNDQQ